MTLNAMFRYPDLYKSGVSVAPVPNQLYYDTMYQERYMGIPSENPEGYRLGSPITFAHQLKGELLLPDAPAFDISRKLYHTRYDHIRPSAVARCQSAQDVRACIDFARRSGTPIHARSGGHSYAGWSTGPGLVIDVGPMNAVSVDPGTHIATIGARYGSGGSRNGPMRVCSSASSDRFSER